jgi:ferrochelatase
LQALARHYELIGGASPYNDQVLDFKGRLERELSAAGFDIPIFIGMKNWHPYLKDILPQIHLKGFRDGLAIPLTPYRSASSGAGYKESLEIIRSTSELNTPSYQFIEGWYDEELFIQAAAEETVFALRGVPPSARSGVPILFSFHSLPIHRHSADPLSRYPGEVYAASALVAKQLRHSRWGVVYQSRPASAKGGWLGPAIEEEVRALAAKGERRVLVVPLGFLCDHAEILYDLDHAAREVIEKSGMQYLRAKTVLQHPKITVLFRRLIEKASL